jgi:hypothetical protein
MWVVEVKTHPIWHPQDLWGDIASESRKMEHNLGLREEEEASLGVCHLCSWEHEGKQLCTFALCTQPKMFYWKLFWEPLKLNVIDSIFVFLYKKHIM